MAGLAGLVRHTYQTRRFAQYCLLVGVTVVLMVPIFWLLVSSLKTNPEVMAYPIKLLPSQPRWLNYRNILSYPPFQASLLRTFGLGLSTAAITCVTCALAGYAFARNTGRASQNLFKVVIVLLMVPYIVTLIPQFVLYARLKLIDTYWPWYLAALGATNPLFIFLYRQFFLNFPRELEEAAEMDGATPAGIFFRIILPNSQPAVTTIFIFAFNAIWGDYLMPTMFLNDPSKMLGSFLSLGFGPQYPAVFMAATVLYILPVVILFLLIQKNIHKGFLFTGFR
jgi:multiple sugar transport system permease protein